MAQSPDPVRYMQESLEYQQKLEEAVPDYPTRPFLLAEDFPKGEQLASMTEARWQLDRNDREYRARQNESGYLAAGYGRQLGPLTPAEKKLQAERDVEYREQCNGLPDAPGEAVAVAHRPFKGLHSR